MMKRLLKKQGFTLVEMMVVVAIIGIMLGIVVPLLTTSSAREREAKEKARAFYSNVQELIMDEMLSNTALSDPYTLIYATVSSQAGTSAAPSIKVYTAGADHIADFEPTVTLTEIAAGDALEEFSNSLKKLLSSNDQEIDVYYYAVVEKHEVKNNSNKITGCHYRLVVTYYSQGKFEDIARQNFSSECRVGSGNILTGAYPYYQCGTTWQGGPVFH